MSDVARESVGRHLVPWSAPLGLVLAAGGIAGLAASALGYRLGWWQVGMALKMAEWAAYAATLALVSSVAAMILSRPGSRRRTILLGLLGVAASLPIVAAAVHWEYGARAYPPINDVSTDTEDPPVFWDMPNPTEYPRGQSVGLQRAAYPDLAPLHLHVARERAYALALALASDKGWDIVAEEPQDGRIEAVDRSFLYGFRDEIVIRISASEGGARIDLRSRSRLGRIDRGVNARRIRAFLAALKQRAGEARP